MSVGPARVDCLPTAQSRTCIVAAHFAWNAPDGRLALPRLRSDGTASSNRPPPRLERITASARARARAARPADAAHLEVIADKVQTGIGDRPCMGTDSAVALHQNSVQPLSTDGIEEMRLRGLGLE